MISLEDKFIGCLLGGAVGDALGFTTENLSRERIRQKFGRLTDYKVRPGKGYYTDDTQMTIAVAETIIANNGFDAPTFKNKLKRWWLVPPRLSGRTMKNAAFKCLLGLEQTGVNSLGNGGAMRAAPLGLFYYHDEEELFEHTLECCKITHTNNSAVAGALVSAFSVAYCLTHETLDPHEYLAKIAGVAARVDAEMAERLLALQAMLDWDEEAALQELLKNSRVWGSPVSDTLVTAVYAFLRYPDSLEDSILFCVNAGWDTDTIAAINGNIVGAWNGQQAIPTRWRVKLENGYKGRDYLVALARGLHNKKLQLPKRNPLTDYLADLWRNYCFLFNLMMRKPKM